MECPDWLFSTSSQIPLEIVSPLYSEQLEGGQLGLAGDHQLINAGLAVSLCKYWLHIKGHLKVAFQSYTLFSSFCSNSFKNAPDGGGGLLKS